MKKTNIKLRNISGKWVSIGSKVLLYGMMILVSYIFLYPFLYMLVTSVMTNDDLNNFTVIWIPRSLNFKNYSMAAEFMKFFNSLKNSLFSTLVTTLGQLISCSMIGYGLARYKFPGKRFAFMIVILAMIVPAQTIIIPQYLLYGRFGWLNTFTPITVPAFFGYGFKGALYIYVFRQFYLGLPKELEEAARVDGCGFLRTYIRIIFPTAKTAYIVVLVLSLVWNWGNYFEPSMYLGKTDMYTLPMSLNNITDALTVSLETLTNSYGIDADSPLNNAVLCAGAVMVIAPLAAMFAFLQKEFIQGIENSGLTGE